MTTPTPPFPSAAWQYDGQDVILEIAGHWRRDGPAVSVRGKPPDRLPKNYDLSKLGPYDSTLPAFLFAHFRAVSTPEKDKKEVPQMEGLPDNLRGLLALALAVPEEIESKPPAGTGSPINRLGQMTLNVFGTIKALLEFAGLTAVSLVRLSMGRARFRSSDFWLTLQQCGAEALPIVALISFLIGLILAFVGNVQLTHFGANLYVADLVGIAMVREMGVVMTANVLSLGEQQRVAFARLFLHQPMFAFLDEATSALDVDNQDHLYALLKESGIGYISVGHRTTLIKLHDRLLLLDRSGRWEMKATRFSE